MIRERPGTQTVLNHFKKVDLRFYRLAKGFGPDIWQIDLPQDETERRLAFYKIIVGQQLSTKSAAAIWRRLKPLLKNDLSIAKPDPLHQAGLSRPKIGYLRNLSGFNFEDLSVLTESDLRARLLVEKGVGEWTVDMALIFIFGHLDVFSWSDLGLKKASALFYDRQIDDFDFLQARIEGFKPYRSLVALILWHWYDNFK